MSGTINYGGSEFPCGPTVFSTSGDDCSRPGMTLRDYFAAKAMQGYLTHEQAANCCSVDLVARWSYEMADAMLRAREEV